MSDTPVVPAKAPPSLSSHLGEHTLAAIDLGSNSFHMVLGRVVDGQSIITDQLKEMVQLGAISFSWSVMMDCPSTTRPSTM